jgi:dihydrofolate reductase
MRKLIVQEWVSLDGCISDEKDRLDFFASTVRATYTGPYHTAFLSSIDHIAFGRKTYEQFVALWPDRSIATDALAHTINTVEKTVFSNSLSNAPWGRHNGATVAQGDPVSTIGNIKSREGKNIVIWGSISLAQLMLKKGLVDELHLLICPTICGGGRKFFAEGTSAATVTLLDSQRHDNGVLRLNYRIKN